MKKRSMVHTLFAVTFIPYLLLCLTMGGFHDSIFNARHCNHTQLSVADNAEGQYRVLVEDKVQHNSEACQICQWLKTPSDPKQFLLHDMRCDCVCINLVYHSNPVLPSLFIQKFTIRPPPAFSC